VILDGLILLKEQRLKRILIQTDNLEVAQALRTDTPTISTSALVRVNVLTTTPADLLNVIDRDKINCGFDI
ncbi:hypothetical protein Gotri_014016, partial [Gossypium trilobum]|nr:hypothetical protein [Gossypium trilobum]